MGRWRQVDVLSGIVRERAEITPPAAGGAMRAVFNQCNGERACAERVLFR